MHSVIFLDIDGVLNTTPPVRLIDPAKVQLLSQLVLSTGADIVLHSGWRIWFSNDLQPLREESALLCDLFAKAGISLCGMTPDLTTEEIRRTRKFSLVKAQEILAWLEQHPDTAHWCVLDDLDLHNDKVAAHQVKPDAGVGLTAEDVAAARIILQRN